jgi:4-hydroxybenzoate polyprenyltransferase
MGTQRAAALTVRRPRWYAYLLLARSSNLPTVWTNVAAGMAAAGSGVIETTLFVRIAAAASCFYTGGMFLNDAFDANHDASARPERPIPAGDVSRREVFTAGAVLLLLGIALLPASLPVITSGVTLAAAILVYDRWHKGHQLAPLVMGACRGLLYVLAAAAVGPIPAVAWAGALVLAGYVSGLTTIARVVGSSARWVVPLLIAGISIVDAVFITAIGGTAQLALVVASGCPATLLLQRVSPGD